MRPTYTPETSWPITEDLRASWRRWGLTIPNLDAPERYPWWTREPPDQVQAKARRHTLVASYLDRHRDVAARYRLDQRGEVRYPEVLALAQAEAETKTTEGGDHVPL